MPGKIVAETEAELGGFYHRFTGDLSNARLLLDRAVKDDPKLAIAHEYLGMLNFDQGKDADAKREFEQAYQLDSTAYLSLFFKTMMSPAAQPNFVGDRDELYSALLKLLAIRPEFAPAYVQLAFYHLRNGSLPNALLMARKAQQAEPARAGYYLLIGRILQMMGKQGDAANVAQYVAERFILSDHNEAVELWNSVPAAQRPLGDALTYTYPPGTEHNEGTVRSVSCADKEKGTKFELVIDHDGQSLHFESNNGFSAGFTDTLWYGEDHFSVCHHLEGKRVITVYKPSKEPGFAGDLNYLEVRVGPPVLPDVPPVKAGKQ